MHFAGSITVRNIKFNKHIQIILNNIGNNVVVFPSLLLGSSFLKCCQARALADESDVKITKNGSGAKSISNTSRYIASRSMFDFKFQLCWIIFVHFKR